MTADLDILHSASMWLELHGDEAVPEARRLAVEMQAKGDLDGADAWLRIIAAVEGLQRGTARMTS